MDKQNEALEKGNVKQLLLQYALPAIIATTATSFYNIIDRIFIGQGVGPLAISGLALTFPIMNLGTALGTLVGAGSSAIISIRMGEKRQEEAIQTLGNAFVLNMIIGILFSVFALIFLDPLLYLFGASDATLPYARDFMRIILLGNVITHLFFGLNNIIRASGYPTKAMISLLLTIGVNIILAPLFIFAFHWGIKGAATATIISQSVGLVWVV
ncbi:MAG: MATE family efflux transporter, partial [Bacteroidetes bacterium]|nr:MATE family efflux transporter [Bacteroidota bacterium]